MNEKSEGFIQDNSISLGNATTEANKEQQFKPITLHDTSKNIARQIIHEEKSIQRHTSESKNFGSQSNTFNQSKKDPKNEQKILQNRQQIKNHMDQINERYKYDDLAKKSMLQRVSEQIGDIMKPKKQDSVNSMNADLGSRKQGQIYHQYSSHTKDQYQLRASRGSNDQQRQQSTGNYQDITRSNHHMDQQDHDSSNTLGSNIMKSNSINKASLNCSVDSIVEQEVHYDSNHNMDYNSNNGQPHAQFKTSNKQSTTKSNTESDQLKNNKDLDQYFKLKLIKVCSLCFLVLAFSQIDSRFTSLLQQFQIAYNSDDVSEDINLPFEPELFRNYIIDLSQVIHLTTAIFLIVLGTHLEYSQNSDLFVLWITVTISVVKLISGIQIMYGSEEYEGKVMGTSSFQIYNWIWVDFYREIPFEVFFAISDSIKYVQFVYLAKWVQRKHLITIIGFWFVFVGLFSILEKQRNSSQMWSNILYTFGQTDDNTVDEQNLGQHLKIKAMQSIMSGFYLMLVGVLQYFMCTFDPLDSGLIINEQCMYLTSLYGLPQVNNIMLKKDFLQRLKSNISKMYSSRDDHQEREASTQFGKVTYIKNKKETIFKEEVEKILGKSQSISFNDLLKIRNSSRVIFAIVCFTINYMISRGMSARLQVASQTATCSSIRCQTKELFKQLNVDILGGVMMIFIGWLSSTYLKGRRMLLLVCSIIFLALWNFTWILFNEIHFLEEPGPLQKLDSQNRIHYTEDDLSLFDNFMYRIECGLTFLVYQLIIIAGPLDISKMHMLQKNQRVYAIMFCMMGSIKLAIQGLIFDKYLEHIIHLRFSQNKSLSIIICLISIAALYPLIEDELKEVIKNRRHQSKAKKQKKRSKETSFQTQSDKQSSSQHFGKKVEETPRKISINLKTAFLGSQSNTNMKSNTNFDNSPRTTSKRHQGNESDDSFECKDLTPIADQSKSVSGMDISRADSKSHNYMSYNYQNKSIRKANQN